MARRTRRARAALVALVLRFTISVPPRFRLRRQSSLRRGMAFRNSRGRGARSAPYASYEEDEGTAVYVGNLPWDCDWKQLKDFMAEGGSVVRADVKTGEDGRSRGFGIVRFATAEDAEYAIENLNGCDMDGRELIVRLDNGGKGSGEGGGGFAGGRGSGKGKGGGKGGGKGKGGKGKGGGKGGRPKSKESLDDDLDSVSAHIPMARLGQARRMHGTMAWHDGMARWHATASPQYHSSVV